MTNAIGVVVMLVGVAIAVWALVGRRVGTEPRCGRCAFDLTGHGDALATCPECGATLSAKSTVRGVRRRRWILATLAVVAVAFGATLAIDVASVARLKRTPTWWLVHVERNVTSSAWRRQIHAELTERVVLGTASVAELAPILDDLRARQRRAHEAVARGEAPSEPWDVEDTFFVVLAFQAGGMPDDDFANFVLDATDVRAIAEPAMAAGAIRPRLVVESPRGLPVEFNAGQMLGGLHITTTELEIAGRTIPLGGATVTGLFPRMSSCGPTELDLDLPAGTCTGTMRATIAVGGVTRTVERSFEADILAEDRRLDYAAVERDLSAHLSALQARRNGATIEVSGTWTKSTVRPPESAVLVTVDRRIASRSGSSQGDGKTWSVKWSFPFAEGDTLSQPLSIEFPWVLLEAPGLDGFTGIVSQTPVRRDVTIAVP
ncbi:MAG: hypothetical protein JNM94_08195 [Phycisphaerae bacterium]|nr:hypothetical protein [Phycisphaerae bacterium]